MSLKKSNAELCQRKTLTVVWYKIEFLNLSALHIPLNTAVYLKIEAINNNFPCTWLNLSCSFYISLPLKELINELLLPGLPQWPPSYICLSARHYRNFKCQKTIININLRGKQRKVIYLSMKLNCLSNIQTNNSWPFI